MTDLCFQSGDRAEPLIIVRSPRARQMRLIVDPRSGAVKLTIPARAPLKPALSWAQSKRSWIEDQLAKLPRARAVHNGCEIEVAGETLFVDWSEAYPRNPCRVKETVRVGGPIDLLGARVVRWLKREAKQLLTAETHEMAAKIGVSIGDVGVGDPVSRWGSCAASGDIRYSWRLILTPDFVRRATVAHEVAHRVHMNHGAAFHGLVADILGDDPKPAHQWLRDHGTSLHWFAR
ncbi:MAG: M48 family metallopeptidase [Sphingomonadaceae bacterium]